MSLLTAPPRPHHRFPPRRPARACPAPALDLPTVPFLGRTLAEYTRVFSLQPDALRGRDVLDVAAGASSFTAEARARRVNAVALDPFYGGPAEDLPARIATDYPRMFEQMRANPTLFHVGSASAAMNAADPAPYFESLEAAELERRAAAQRFLADYAAHYSHGWYVGAALPHLPFFDRTFDVVLCADLLFLHAARFDFDWHIAACRELLRVSAAEVRIHPICGCDGKPWAKLPPLRRELRARGIESEVVGVDYRFFAGSGATLVLRRSPTDDSAAMPASAGLHEQAAGR